MLAAADRPAKAQPDAAQPPSRDAAVQAREGDVDHWIEYYKKQREAAPATKQQGADEKAPGTRR